MATSKMAALAGTLLLAVAVSAPATAADWAASFKAPQGLQDSLRIDLPDDLDLAALTTLGAELDGNDITALLSLDGNDFVYTPVTPLAGGRHTVRLVRLDGSGQVEELHSWSFSVAEPAGAALPDAAVPDERHIAQAEEWLRSGSVALDTLTETSIRVADNNLNNAPNRTIVSGAGDLDARTERDNWTLRGHANYLLQTDHDLASTGRTMDLGEYEMAADYNGDRYKGGVTLGHHDLGVDSLLMSSFYRRGASARLGRADDRVMAETFAFTPESLSGGKNISGLNDDDRRIEGVSASFRPLSADPDSLNISSLYYDGRGADEGAGIAGTDVVSEGSGWTMIAGQSFGDGRLRLRGEYAHTGFDRDGDPGAAAKDDGDAYALSAEARPFDMTIGDKSADLVLGAAWQRIGTFFESLANPGLAADRDAFNVFGNFYWDSLSAGLNATRETNNVDDLKSTPTDQLRNLNGFMTWTFDRQQGDRAWLGTPYLNLSGFIAALDRKDTPVGYTGPGADNASRSLTLGGGSNYDACYWSLSHTISDYEDQTNVAAGTVSNLTSLNGGWNVNDNLDVHGGLQFGVFHDEGASTTAYDTNINLGGEAVLVPQTLNLNLDYNLNLGSGDSDLPDRHIVNSELEWTFSHPRANRPGFAMAVRGTMESTDGNATAGIQDETQYSIFTVLRIKAPFSFLY